jgi:hypothetical protein
MTDQKDDHALFIVLLSGALEHAVYVSLSYYTEIEMNRYITQPTMLSSLRERRFPAGKTNKMS